MEKDAGNGASTTSLGNLFQCLTTLIVKNFFLISSLNLPSFSLKPLPLVLSLHALVKSPSPAQDTVDFLGCKHTLLAHVQLFVHQYPQVLLLRAALNPLSTQPVFVLGIAPTQVQGPCTWPC
ncbi:hypothetical protein QYF61_011879 [Mycteria americana]|uniref:Uncharacterized protein n=1 Tax=Mycteria americana TaxID=33587 RepID=A0AAN7N5J6_MYCAM|nr:hypothetical protein QYF61_011879 [Mycteria americana]